jgi:aminoglycoside phosphotransferase (APT) family kinase protein
MDPADLEPLLARAGLTPGACRLLKVSDRAGGRTLLQLSGPSGQRLKVRRFDTAEAAAAMVHRRGLIGEHEGFARVLACCDTLVLEEWVEGATLDRRNLPRRQAHAAGLLLAGLHRCPRPADVPAQAGILPLLEESRGRLQELSDRAALPADAVRRLDAALLVGAPRQARQGLIHFDFCGENLIWSPVRGVLSIDNEKLRPGPLAADLGRAWALWPLSGPALQAFHSGYDAGGGPAERDCLPFWQLVGLVTSAWYRVRHQPAAAVSPLRRLRALAGGRLLAG